MSEADPAQSLCGSFEDVISFFGISERTGRRWTSTRKIRSSEKDLPPRLASWRHGRIQTFGEEAVVELRAQGYVACRRLAPGEAREIARREWREHLQARRGAQSKGGAWDDLVRRVERLEKLLDAQSAHRGREAA